MKKQSDLIKERLQSVMLFDRGNVSDRLLIALKSDLTELLSSYMYVVGEGVSVSIEADAGGGYELSVRARADRLIDVGKMAD